MDCATGRQRPTRLTDVAAERDAAFATFSPDGTRIVTFFSRGCGASGCHHLFTLDADGSDFQKLVTGVPDTLPLRLGPGGLSVAIRRRLTVLSLSAIAALVALGGTSAEATYPGPNGRIAFSDYVSGQIYAVNPDGSASRAAHTTSTRTTPPTIRVGLRTGRGSSSTCSGSTPDDDHSRIWIMDADGSHQSQVASETPGFRDYAPKFTPDGSEIVFSRCQPNDGVCAIWEMRSDGTHKQALTPFVHDETNEIIDFVPSVSPDGTQIAFGRFADGGFFGRIFVMNADGSDPHSITPPRFEGFAPDWAPDGQRLTFSSYVARLGSAVFSLRPDGSDIERLTENNFPFNDFNSVYSPRGNRIAFSSDRKFPDLCCEDLFEMRAAGGAGHPLGVGLSPPGIINPAWGSAPLVP